MAVKLGRAKTIREPVHGDIAFSPKEIAIMDTREMQRLRGIRQLGTTYLVYPGAVHTRFEHSLGTCWMAKKIIDALRKAGSPLDPEESEAVALAALLHDITHLPFGHTLEDERRILPRHDEDPDRLESLIRNSEIGEKLAAFGQLERVLEILGPGDPLDKEQPCPAQIVSYTICADLLDYLKRDNYYCGLSQHYDDRIFRYFHRQDDTLVLLLFKGGLFRHDALSEVINLLRIRYFLTERVYYHHAKIAAGMLIARAVEAAMTHGLTAQELARASDESLLFILEGEYSRIEAVQKFVSAYRRRALPKKAYVLSARIGEKARRTLVSRYHLNRRRQRQRAEREIAADLGIPAWGVSIYCPPLDMHLKEADVLVKVDPGPLRHLASLGHQEVQALQDRYRNLWRFYVFIHAEFNDRLAQAGEACAHYFRLPNELGAIARGQLELFGT